MNTQQLIATAVEVAIIGGILAAVTYTTLAAGETEISQQETIIALTDGPSAPSMEISDEFIQNFVVGKIEDGLREKYGVGVSGD